MPHSFISPSVDPGLHLHVDGLSFSFPDRRVLTDLSLVVPAGDRVGVIGENGSGKSTLLRLVAGRLESSSGTITINAAAADSSKIGLLHQEAPFAPTDSISESLENAVAPLRRAAEAVNELGAALADDPEASETSDAYARALDTADRLGAWEIDTRISATLSGFGLGEIDPARLTGSLSGGQRARLALAWLLLSAPDLLLLDEPTNHLDDDATAYLVSVLTVWRGPVLMASHDRAFLDEAATSLLDLDPSPIPHQLFDPHLKDDGGTGIGATRFTGTYSDYLTERAQSRRRWERRYRDEQDELARLRATVKSQQAVGHSRWRPRSEVRMAQKFYADRNAKVVSRRVNDARARLSELETQQIRKPPPELAFQGLTAAGSPHMTGTIEPVLTATDVTVRGRLTPTSLSVGRGEKWLVTGPNGSGKSTLLSLLSGALAPTGGQIARASNARVRILTQDTDLPDPYGRGSGRTALDTYADLVGITLAERVPLSTFGLLAGRDHHRPVAELSVGQRRRLALAVLLADPPEILLLDEPTNHFSLGLVTALEKSLATFSGTVVIASHDRWLRSRWIGYCLTLSERPSV